MFIVGFDLGKNKSQICVEDETGKVLAQIRVDTEKVALAEVFQRFPKSRVLIESSTSSEWVAQHLEALGCEVVVGDPRFTPMYAHGNKKIKTDKRDAKALADALRMGAFRKAHRRTRLARELQTMLNVRKSLIGARTRLINLVRSSAEREGVRIGKCSGGDQFLDELFEVIVPGWLADGLAPAVEQIAALTEQIKGCDRVVNKAARTEPVAKNLQTAIGVGPVVALSFMAVIDDPKRFTSATEVVAYLGLAPGQRNSGESKRAPGAITKAGDPMVRGYLYEAAMTILRSTSPASPLQDWGLKLKAKHHDAKKKAIVAVMRRLARILWAMWRDGSLTTANLRPPTL